MPAKQSFAGPTAQAQPALGGAYLVYLIPSEVAAWRATAFGDPIAECFLEGDLYVSDVSTHNIVKITSERKQSVFLSGEKLVSFLSERGIKLSPGTDGPVALACKDRSLFVAVALLSRSGMILKVTVPDANISIYTEDPLLSMPAERLTYRGPFGLAFWQDDLFVTTWNRHDTGGIVQITPDGKVVPFVSGLHEPAGLAFNKTGELFVAESTSDGKIIRISPDKQMTTLAKDLYYPTSLVFSGEDLLVSESGVGKILRITPQGHKSVAFVGFSIAYEANFYRGFEGPIALAVNPAGDLFVMDNTRTPYTTALYRIYKDKERWKVELFNEWQKAPQ